MAAHEQLFGTKLTHVHAIVAAAIIRMPITQCLSRRRIILSCIMHRLTATPHTPGQAQLRIQPRGVRVYELSQAVCCCVTRVICCSYL
jgi:hypothetical protein